MTTEITLEIAEYTDTAVALANFRTKYENAVFAVTTPAGMRQAIEARREIREHRVALEKKRVEIKAPALERCRLIDSEAKRITFELEALEEPIDSQIKYEEARKEREKREAAAREQQRKDDVEAIMRRVRQYVSVSIGKPSAAIIEQFQFLRDWKPNTDAFTGEEILELTALVESAYTDFERMIAEAEAHEAEQAKLAAEREDMARQRAELERQQAELAKAQEATRAAQEAAESAERKAREAEARIERERAEQALAAENARLQAESAERERIEREHRELAEQGRREAEARQAEEAEARRVAEEAAELARLESLGLREAAKLALEELAKLAPKGKAYRALKAALGRGE